MNRKSFYALFFVGLVIIVFSVSQLFSYPSGAPAAKTGSPGDVKTCTACHKATLKAQEGMITSDIPNNMYEPGKVYKITCTASGTDNVARIGFEASPQDKTGKLMGQIIITEPERTKVIAKGKYITHTSNGSIAKNGKNSWTFNWKAPAAGSGDVTIYASFLVSETSQLVFTSNLPLNEKK